MKRAAQIRTTSVAFWSLCALCWTILQAPPVVAQLSPGELSHPHTHLEGLRKCGQCHALGSREVRGKCLDCHDEIAAARAEGHGLHAQPDFDDCVDCHVEHQGVEYDLIFWPDGPEGLDHAELGFPLADRHGELACRACHRTEKVVRSDALLAAGKDLDRTYLGLGTACTDCHADVHLDQLAADCTACHDTRAWRPAPGFAHDAVFPLRGRHAETACARCHAPLPDDDPATLRIVTPRRTLCTDCHDDPHAGSLGIRCADCHTPAGWRDVAASAFDHDRTAYPLRGRHATVACAGCHGGERARPTHNACTDCHDDRHGGAANGRPALLRCEDCHGVGGYRPARFTLAGHDATAFPLRGAHRATPCDACHRPASDAATELILTHEACTDCHDDPHARPPGREPSRCTACHDPESWHHVTFDHDGTGFALANRHAAAACRACHPAPEAGTAPTFAGTPRDCAGCHDDIHRNQFLREGESAPACDRCHVTLDWLAERFDHDRDSRFPLRGGHRDVACAKCHPLPAPGDETPRRFKPLDMACLACHTAKPATGGARP